MKTYQTKSKNNAKNLHARGDELKYILNDQEFMEFLYEMFTSDDEGVPHPELLKIGILGGKVCFGCKEDEDDDRPLYEIAGFYVLKCNYCGEYSVADFMGLNTTWEQQTCFSCGKVFTQIGGCKDIEW